MNHQEHVCCCVQPNIAVTLTMSFSGFLRDLCHICSCFVDEIPYCLLAAQLINSHSQAAAEVC